MHQANDVKLTHIIPLIAICMLLVGTLATVYVKSFHEQETMGTIDINGTDVYIATLFREYEEQELETSVDETHNGIPIPLVLSHAGIEKLSEHRYSLSAPDGYSKEVEWKFMLEAVLTEEGRIVFSNLPKQFWVRDLVKIKVI